MKSRAGLYQKLVTASGFRKKRAAVAEDPETEPRDAHIAAENVGLLDREIISTAEAIEESERFIGQIEEMAAALGKTGHPSAHRTLALRHLEDAALRLRLELGDKPQNHAP